jgi:hypothetical protein
MGRERDFLRGGCKVGGKVEGKLRAPRDKLLGDQRIGEFVHVSPVALLGFELAVHLEVTIIEVRVVELTKVVRAPSRKLKIMEAMQKGLA